MICLWRLLFVCVAVWESHGAGQRELLALMMPEVGAGGVKHNDYMCQSAQLQPVDTSIVQFEPRANPLVAHHMLLYGCPGKPNARQSWSCKSSGLICGLGKKSQILFAWALNASGLHLPDEVGLEIGPSHDINYAVLQIHYGHPEAVSTDALMGEHEALVLHLTQEKQPFVAGVYILGSSSTIAAGKEAAHVDTACPFGGPNPIQPFAFRTHAHSLGQVIAGYVVKDGNEDWELIGSRSPQDAQAFYPAMNSVTVNPGDWLAARCVFNTQAKAHDVHMGANSEDEMCNFYIMYYMVNNGRSLVADFCWNRAPDDFHFPELHVPEPVPSDGTETEADRTHSHTEPDGDKGSEDTVDEIISKIDDIMGALKGDGESPTTEATTPPTTATVDRIITTDDIMKGDGESPTTEATALPTTATVDKIITIDDLMKESPTTEATTPPTTTTSKHQSEVEEEGEDNYVCPSRVPPGPPSICPKPQPASSTAVGGMGPATEATPPGSTQAAAPESTLTTSPQATHDQETHSQGGATHVATDTAQNQDPSAIPTTVTHDSSPSPPPTDSKMPLYVYGIIAGVVVVTIVTALLIIGIQYDKRCRWYLLSLCKDRSTSFKEVSTEMRTLRGSNKQGFHKLPTHDSDSEAEEFAIYSRV